jgi:hypothetical protein
MPTMRYNPPLVVDLSAILLAEGVDIPLARIKIYSAFFAGKKSLMPGNCYYLLGQNGWNNLTEYTGALRNYAEPPEGVFARDHWFYNQCNFACQREIERHEHEQASSTLQVDAR